MLPRRRWRRLLRSLHLYGGLLCSGYLVVYGLSSLLFSHHIERLERDGPTREWTDTLSAPITRAEPGRTARRIATELGLVGRVTPEVPIWTDSTGLSFNVSRPGHRFVVRAVESGEVSVKGTKLGPVTVLKGLHDARRYPDSFALSLWWNYTHLTVLVLLFSTMSGIFLWFGQGRFTTTGWVVLVGGSLACVALIGWLVA